jgi:predicted metal-binding membrane protein
MADAVLETLLKREGAVVLAALIVLTLLAWLAVLAGGGTGMDPAAMSGWWLSLAQPPALSSSWSPLYWLIAFCMWSVMMVAMMLPSAAPSVLLYALIVRRAEAQGRTRNASASVGAFLLGYLTLWILFSVLAVALQFALEQSGAMSAMMNSRSALLSGALLIAAGLYQLTPLKQVCLKHCHGPAAFVAAHWRPGVGGAWRMGLAHGVYCVGCCAVLMLLLFVGGVMNLVWLTALTLFVALEKLAPMGPAAGKALAGVLMAAGAALLALG